MSGLAILDLGYGNTRSVALAFERLGIGARLTDDPAVAANAERLVLPGVGAAGPAMARLAEAGLADVIRRRTGPTLGICLGMQLLFERSEEGGSTPLLGLVPGTVEAITPTRHHPVPHMGWSRVNCAEPSLNLDDAYLYFAHSFRCPEGAFTVATTDYGGTIVPAAIRRGPLWGAQFHPERSSDAGMRFLEAFAGS